MNKKVFMRVVKHRNDVPVAQVWKAHAAQQGVSLSLRTDERFWFECYVMLARQMFS